jgi:hypothetical protein
MCPTETGFSIWEAGTDALLYAEVFSVEWLLELELLGFLELLRNKLRCIFVGFNIAFWLANGCSLSDRTFFQTCQ